MKWKFTLRHLGIVLVGVGLAILLPTPIFLLVAGGWLGWKGFKKTTKSDDTDEPR